MRNMEYRMRNNDWKCGEKVYIFLGEWEVIFSAHGGTWQDRDENIYWKSSRKLIKAYR